MSIKKGEATIKDLSQQEMSKVVKLMQRLEEEKKQKQHFKNLYQQLKIQHQQLKRDMAHILQAQHKDAEQNKFLKLQLNNSLKKLEPLRSSFVFKRSNVAKQDQDPNIIKNVSDISEKNRSSSRSKKKQISDLKNQIQKMSKQLKYYTPPLPFIEKDKLKQVQKQKSYIEYETTSPMSQKIKIYETIKSRYQSNQNTSFIQDQATKLCDIPRKASQAQYITARKTIVVPQKQKHNQKQRNNFYSTDLLDLVEML